MVIFHSYVSLPEGKTVRPGTNPDTLAHHSKIFDKKPSRLGHCPATRAGTPTALWQGRWFQPENNWKDDKMYRSLVG